VQLFTTLWLTLPSIQSRIPLCPRFPTMMRSASLARDASMMVWAGLPSMTMGTVRSLGFFVLISLLILLSIFLWLSLRSVWYWGRYVGMASSVNIGGG